ncbi:MAG: TonB family protein [Vicinamibacteria bacterium]
MRDAVSSVIAERQRLDSGLPASLAVSGGGHLLLIGAMILAPMLLPKKPPIQITEGFAVPMPPGGGGPRAAEPPAPAAAEAAPAPPAAEPAPAPPPKVIKPPKREPEKKKGLPAPDAKKAPKRTPPKKPEPPATAYDPSQDRRPRAAGPGGTDTGAAAAGLGLELPPGPGVPGGTDWLGDWYLAGVQRKIWTIWTQQLKADFNTQVSVRFTIEADGSVSGVAITRSSGAALLDLAAQRAVASAAPFGPLPRNYGTNRITVQANFKPTS